MIVWSTLRSRWLVSLLLAAAVGMFGCTTTPALDEEKAAATSDAATAAAVCGGPAGIMCPSTDYCVTPANTCPGPDQRGVCRPRPQICRDVVNPVCGCDGRTYSNACFAAAAGVDVASTGACQPSQPCGGLLAIPCPGGSKCVDDPSDDCDPNNGGADCIGICVPDEPRQTCGGFLGTPCPGGSKCVDDPSDDCDPRNGGADCIGICVP